MSIILGIDTGGTYTDVVACDNITHEVFACAKSLTTPRNLSEGILSALRQIPLSYREQTGLVSLSTTLATNACVEDKGCRAMLIMFGVDEETFLQFGSGLGNYNRKEICFADALFKCENGYDWALFKDRLMTDFSGYEAYAITEMNANRSGANLEKKAREIIKGLHDRPVVCGHELFTELNVMKRGLNTLLNARLIPLITDFLDAIRYAMEELSIHAPVTVMRSDGTLMSSEYAKSHPIETLLCGPAASVMGAKEQTSLDRTLISDVGGTTTDVAFIEDGRGIFVNGNVRIGDWSTLIHGLFIDTFALGGDTGIHYTKTLEKTTMLLDTRRMIPACMLAHEYPQILPELEAASKLPPHTRHLHEFLLLRHMPLRAEDYSERELKICELLQERPLSCGELANRLDISIYSLKTERLEQDGILMRSGLTPTDIMHIKGDYEAYDKEAAYYSASAVANNLKISVEELCDQVYSAMKYRLFANLARILIERDYPHLKDLDPSVLDLLLKKQWQECYQQTDMDNTSGEHFTFHIRSSYPLVGLGGPAAIFVPDVARVLGSSYTIPPYASVANALGAALGQITFSLQIHIECIYKTDEFSVLKPHHLLARGSGISREFSLEEEEPASQYAVSSIKEQALREASLRGIEQAPDIQIKVTRRCYPNSSMLNEILVEAIVKE